MSSNKSYAEILAKWQEDDAMIVKEMQQPVTRYLEQQYALAERRNALTTKTLMTVLDKLARQEKEQAPATP